MRRPKYNSETLKLLENIVNGCTGCKKCMKECIMMNDFGESPKNIFRELLVKEEINPIVPYSCTMCNKCTIVCPENLKIPKAFMNIREAIIKENGGKSTLKGHKAVYMHQLISCGLLNIFTTRR